MKRYLLLLNIDTPQEYRHVRNVMREFIEQNPKADAKIGFSANAGDFGGFVTEDDATWEAWQNRFICPNCEKQDVETNEHIKEFDYGSGDNSIKMTVLIPLRSCRSCKFEYFDYEAEDIIDKTIRNYQNNYD